MARKSTDTTSTTRSRKAVKSTEPSSLPPTPAQAAPEILGNRAPAVVAPPRTTARAASANVNGGNLDEEIRRRAYELYLQRNGASGDPNRDWFVAEREVRARRAAAGHSA
jgi:Protein of unknown function (DUF2934)